MKKNKKLNKVPRSIRKAFPKVKTIVDAKTPLIVHVNESDCADSEPLNPNRCAMARAAKREFKVDAAVIGLSSSYIIKGSKATRFDTPIAVQREIVSFDRHKDFEPGIYKLVPKPPSSRLTAKRKYHPGGTRNNKMAVRKYHRTAKVRSFTPEE